MSGEVETSQAEVDLKALEGFRAGNQDLERLEALLDAYHLLRLRGRGVEACLREEEIEIFMPDASYQEFVEAQ